MKHYFFIGIGGSGVSALAHIIRAEGNVVEGSDRAFDRQSNPELFRCLHAQGIRIHQQDGCGVSSAVDEVIISAAVEQDNPDVKKAQALSLPITFRSELLARIFNVSLGIGVAGSSGKSTITAMAARIMDRAGLDPTVINGAVIQDYKAEDRLGNARKGRSPYMLIETDESDGSIVHFRPEISILANISKDHKPVPELKQLFLQFLINTKAKCILNKDCPHTEELVDLLPAEKVITFGFTPEGQVTAERVYLSGSSSTFAVRDIPFFLAVPGRHNVSNALAAIALGKALEIPLPLMASALQGFSGVDRRLQLIGRVGGIAVYDDFSHNPAKIAAAIETLRGMGSRLILIFQPHGYGPVRLLENELIDTFNTALSPHDMLFLLEIYYAGGTADQSISSTDLLRRIHVPQAALINDRNEVSPRVCHVSAPGDIIVVMGARDDTLTELAWSIVTGLQNKTSCREEEPFNPTPSAGAAEGKSKGGESGERIRG
jgi:UDP-N-acetylmuramate--alanine ligase